jgi:hypothetical protein
MLSPKQLGEQSAFKRFISLLGKSTEWNTIISRPEPEPDLLCVHATRGPIAFELVSLTDPNLAKVLSSPPAAHSAVFSTEDPSERIVRNKLTKKYQTTAPRIELLIYTDGRIITPDDAIIPAIQPWLDTYSHSFRKVWFMGQHELRLLWSDA